MTDTPKEGLGSPAEELEALMAEENACMQVVEDSLDARDKQLGKVEQMGRRLSTQEERESTADFGRLYLNASKRLLTNYEQTFSWYKNNDPQNRNYLVYLIKIKHLIAEVEAEERMIDFIKGKITRTELEKALVVTKIMRDVLTSVGEALAVK